MQGVFKMKRLTLIFAFFFGLYSNAIAQDKLNFTFNTDSDAVDKQCQNFEWINSKFTIFSLVHQFHSKAFDNTYELCPL